MTARPADSPEHVREALVRLQTASALLERVLADEVGSGPAIIVAGQLIEGAQRKLQITAGEVALAEAT